jgi:hypothetical protein
MVRQLKTTRLGAYRFPRYLEDQDFYCYSTDSDGHHGVSEEGSGANFAPGKASPPASVIELLDDEPEEELLTQNPHPTPSRQQAEQAGLTHDQIPKRASQFS